MKIYVLVKNDDGEASFDLPQFGRTVRAYLSEGRAKSLAKKFGCEVVALNLEDGEVITDEV